MTATSITHEHRGLVERARRSWVGVGHGRTDERAVALPGERRYHLLPEHPLSDVRPAWGVADAATIDVVHDIAFDDPPSAGDGIRAVRAAARHADGVHLDGA